MELPSVWNSGKPMRAGSFISESMDNLAIDESRLAAVCAEHNLRLLILHGSRATHSPPPGPDSDLDLAVWMPGVDFHECFRALYTRLASIFPGYNIDLSLLNRVDPLFRYEVTSHGKLLYGDVDDFLEYQSYAYRAFVDSSDLRALEDILFRKKMDRIHEILYAAN